jgi:hypothetical protein
LQVKHFEQSVIILIQQNRCASGSTQFHRTAHVIDVRVRNHDLLYV